jgi:hypothetical protein
MFDDSFILRQGLEYSATLPCGHIVQYISKDTARVYEEERGASVAGPKFGPFIPACMQ